MNFIEWELSREAEIDEDITTSYNLNRTCFYSLQGYNVYLIHGKSSSTIYVCMQIYLVLKLLRVLTQYGQIRSPGPTLWRCFRCLLLGAESASIQNDLYVFQDVSLGFFNFPLTLKESRINNIANASHFRRFETFFYTLPDQYFWRTSDNDNAPP